MKIILKTPLLLGTLLVFIISSCKKDKVVEPDVVTPPQGYAVPATYIFTNTDYSGQTFRMEMLDEIVTYMKTARVANTNLSATTLKNMFSNTGNPFTNSILNTSGKQLENKCFYLDVNTIKSYMDSITAASTNSLNITASITDPSRKYLINANGFDYTEIIEKSIMGAAFYYQALESYINYTRISAADNATVITGQGTVMEHYWDEGFGYLGVPKDFPTNTAGVVFWGEYLNDVGTVLGNKSTMMNAFIKGRAAISNKDYTTRDAQITIISTEWEKLIAASAIHELNEAKSEFADNAIRNHVMSEARGFIMCLKYKTNKLITQTKIDDLIYHLGTNHNTITIANINLVIDDLANIYGLQSIKSIL